jgi:hypothetical protein
MFSIGENYEECAGVNIISAAGSSWMIFQIKELLCALRLSRT